MLLFVYYVLHQVTGMHLHVFIPCTWCPTSHLYVFRPCRNLCALYLCALPGTLLSNNILPGIRSNKRGPLSQRSNLHRNSSQHVPNQAWGGCSEYLLPCQNWEGHSSVDCRRYSNGIRDSYCICAPDSLGQGLVELSVLRQDLLSCTSLDSISNVPVGINIIVELKGMRPRKSHRSGLVITSKGM